ncbi:ABC transporter substrate-binding protein [Aerosakkonemataceae cyanobacterium BLCC-F50]|uniref:ABC transporter substrate-binding protein n=1 Tax=Floridaenema flaviceps BLCC-F50 TaxID=3153642 RepID=A0ABV4XMY9_9CYAN
MGKQVIFRIEQGNFETGFPITLTIRENREVCVQEVKGRLAPAPEVIEHYNNWQTAYYSWGESNRWWRRQINVPPQTNSNYSNEDTRERVINAADRLEQEFNDWLDRSSLAPLKQRLLHTVGQNDSVNFIIKTDNQDLQKLPWELWRFLQEYYDYAEVALSSTSTRRRGALKSQVKILVILGSDEKIDIQTDWNILQDKLNNAKLILLREPGREEFVEKLVNQPWDIIFFAGHSSTHPSGNDGGIWINNNKNDEGYLSTIELERYLRIAVRNGLKLAIFNSCDGLGLARKLEKLQIPHIIVMRQPIHDEVAQKFLNDFLTSFAHGASLHQAVHDARDRLRLLIDNSSPNASWLPVIFQNPEEPPLFYPPKPPIPINWKIVLGGIGGTIALFTLGLAIYKFNELSKDATLAPGISLGEEIISEKNITPEKEAGVKAFRDKNYLEAIEYFKASLQKNPNDPETRIYLNNVRAANTKATIKIAVSVPLGSNQPIGEEMLRGVAEVQEEINRDDGIMGKQLQVIIANDNNNDNLAKENAEKFVKDPAIFAVIGHNGSNASVAAAPIYQQGKLVMISPTSFANQLKADSYVFRLVPQITFFAAQLSQGLGKVIPQPKVAICVDNISPDQESFKNEFKYVVTAYKGQHIEVNCNFSDRTFRLSSVIDVIKNQKVNSLMVAPYVDNLPKAIALFKEVKQNKLPVKLFGSPTLYNDKTVELGRDAVEGLTLSVPYFPNQQEKESFGKLWKTELNTWRASTAKDTTIAIATALQELLKQPDTTRQNLDQILRNPNFKVQGITGEFKFNSKTGEREFLFQQQRPDTLVQVQNGKFVKIE